MILLKNSLYITPPKTASRFLKYKLRNYEIVSAVGPVYSKKTVHCTVKMSKREYLIKNKVPIILLIRNPLDWYKSYYFCNKQQNLRKHLLFGNMWKKQLKKSFSEFLSYDYDFFKENNISFMGLVFQSFLKEATEIGLISSFYYLLEKYKENLMNKSYEQIGVNLSINYNYSAIEISKITESNLNIINLINKVAL